jgi:hypothetical protein
MATPSRRVLVAAIAVSSPLSLGVETALRTLLFTDDMRDLRAMVGPSLTPVAWAMVGLTAVAAVVGVAVQGAAFRHALRSRDASDPDARERARVQALYVASSVPQLPALVATFLFTGGAALTPVTIALLIAALGVLALGVMRGD